MVSSQPSVLTTDGIAALLEALHARGYRLIGPRIRDQAIVYDDIASLADLPCGWTDEQDGGHYRLIRRDDDALFGYAVGPHSWKKFLHTPEQRLWRAERSQEGMRVQAELEPAEPVAFLGVRSCELHAIAIQDRVLLEGAHSDPHYRARRAAVFLVAINCAKPGGTCFCASMNTGPKVAGDYDLVLTEIEAMVNIGLSSTLAATWDAPCSLSCRIANPRRVIWKPPPPFRQKPSRKWAA